MLKQIYKKLFILSLAVSPSLSCACVHVALSSGYVTEQLKVTQKTKECFRQFRIPLLHQCVLYVLPCFLLDLSTMLLTLQPCLWMPLPRCSWAFFIQVLHPDIITGWLHIKIQVTYCGSKLRKIITVYLWHPVLWETGVLTKSNRCVHLLH